AARTATDPAARTATDPAARTATDPAARTATDPAARTATDPAAHTATDPAARAATDPAARAPVSPVHLATTQRVIRTQPFPKLPGYAAHFRIFILASGGIETKDHAFTATAFELHIRTMLAALDRLERHG